MTATRARWIRELKEEYPWFSDADTVRTPCTSAVLAFFGFKISRGFCQSLSDVRRHLRRVGKKTLNQKLPRPLMVHEIMDFFSKGIFLVFVEGHVFLIEIFDGGHGMRVLVDTMPERGMDRRSVEHLYLIV